MSTNDNDTSPSPARNEPQPDNSSEKRPTAAPGDPLDPVDEILAEFTGREPASDGQSAESQMAQLNQELQDAQDRVLRAQADLENYRKRVRREMDDERRFAALPLLRDLLPVIDNLNRAIESVSSDEAGSGLLAGVKMVEQQLRYVLKNHNCEPIAAAGEPFDPMRHEAIGEQPSGDHPRGTVLLVAQTGYRLHDRVIRPSQVIVSKDAV